jgi:hypothetical protein
MRLSFDPAPPSILELQLADTELGKPGDKPSCAHLTSPTRKVITRPAVGLEGYMTPSGARRPEGGVSQPDTSCAMWHRHPPPLRPAGLGTPPGKRRAGMATSSDTGPGEREISSASGPLSGIVRPESLAPTQPRHFTATPSSSSAAPVRADDRLSQTPDALKPSSPEDHPQRFGTFVAASSPT